MPSAISIAVIPKLYTSAAGVNSSPRNASALIHKGEPPICPAAEADDTTSRFATLDEEEEEEEEDATDAAAAAAATVAAPAAPAPPDPAVGDGAGGIALASSGNGFVLKCSEMPKSVSLICPLDVSRMLAALMSR